MAQPAMLSGVDAVMAAGDTSASVTVWLLVVGLVAVGVLAVLTAVWTWRGTRVDSPALAVLEEMSRPGESDADGHRDATRDERNREIHRNDDVMVDTDAGGDAAVNVDQVDGAHTGDQPPLA